MPSSNLHRPDTNLVPLQNFMSTPKNTLIPVIDNTFVGDWSTLHISANTNLISNALAQENLSAAVILIQFMDDVLGASGTSVAFIGGRTLCTGACRLRNLIIPSDLDVRLPIPSKYVNISIYFPSVHTNVASLGLGAWLSRDATYVSPMLEPIGWQFDFAAGFHGDSIFAPDNSGTDNTARGILVPPGINIVEFAQQTIGKLSIHFKIESETGAQPAAGEVSTWIASKPYNDTLGNVSDEVHYQFGNTIETQGLGIPMNGFRQGIAMLNFSNPSRNFIWHVAAYPEFI